jgi:hypothetical protein
MLGDPISAHPFFAWAIPAVAILLLTAAYYRGQIEMGSLSRWLETGTAFFEWRERNPGVYIGLSEEGRKLLRQHIEASERYYKLHSWIDGSENLEYLNSLFFDLPPKYPDSLPEEEKRASNMDVPFNKYRKTHKAFVLKST